jgi:hypothetical protein
MAKNKSSKKQLEVVVTNDKIAEFIAFLQNH